MGKNKIFNWYYLRTVYTFFKKGRLKQVLSLVFGARIILLCLISLLVSSGFNAFGQTTTLWNENFTYNDRTTTATKDGITWTAGGVNGSGDGVAVFNNRLKLERTDRDNGIRNTWITNTSIDILDYVNVSISMNISSSSGLESAQDFIQVEYQIDNGSWIILGTNGYLQGNISGIINTSQTGLSGSTLLLRIVASNDNNEMYYVDNIEVTGLETVSPSCAILSSPANGTTDVDLNTELDWNADQYSSDYYLYFGTDNPPTNIINGTSYTATYFSPPADLNANTTYYWKVVPYNSVGQASGCPVWSFTTGATASVDTIVKQLFNAGQDLVFIFPFNSCAIISDALLTVTAKGDINESPDEFYNIITEAGILGQMGPTLSGGNNDCDLETKQFTIINSDIQAFAADNVITIIADPQSGVDELCPAADPSYVEMRLRYSYVSIPTCYITAPATVCNNEQNIVVSGPPEMASYSWSITSGDAVISGPANSEFLTVNAGSSDFTVALTVESYPGCSSTCSVDVLVDSESVIVGVVSPDQTICDGGDPSDITLTGSVGTIQWQVSTDHITFNDIAGATSSTLTSAQIGVLTSTTYYRAMVDGGLCVARSSVVIVDILEDLSATIIGGTSAICAGTSPGTFTATGSGGSGTYSFQWYLNGAATATTQTYDPGNLAVDAAIYCEVSSSPCGSVNTSVINIDVTQPATPIVGTITQPDCNVSTGSVELSGLPASGTWQLTRNPGGITTLGSGTTTTISGLSPGTYNFTVTEESANIPCPGTGTGLLAEYFNNRYLTAPSTLTRTDATVDFNWGNGSPDASIANDNFSVRWTGKIVPCYSENYTFTTNSDDGIRLWVNGVQLINNWTDHAPTLNTGNINLVAGQKYDIVLEFYENAVGAVAELYWQSASLGYQIVPQTNLYLSSDFIPDCTSLASADATINAVPVISTQPTDLTICEGGSGSLNVASTAATPSYQWEYTNSLVGPITWTAFVNNANISGSTSDQLQLINASTAYNGLYASCLITAGGCQLRSDPVLLTINYSPTITLTPTDEICPTDNNGEIATTLSGGLTNIQYVKLTQTYVNPDAWQQVEEIQAFEVFTNTNVALSSNGAIATASSYYANDPSYAPSLVNDGISTGYNFWHSNSPNVGEWVMVDFGEPKNIEYLRIFNREDCCWQRGQNMLLELYDSGNNLIYSRTVDLWEGVNGAHDIVVDVIDLVWNDSGTSLNRTGLATGDYTLNYTDANGCSSSATETIVTTNTESTAPTSITGTKLICNGESTTLTVSGGALGTGASWNWYSGNCGGTFVGTGTSITVSPAANTSYFVRAEGTCNTTGCVSSLVSVNPLPTATISGDAALCNDGSNTTISVVFSGTAPWNIITQLDGANDVPVTNILSSPYTFDVAQEGVYTVSSVSDANCTGTFSGSATVAVNPIPSIILDSNPAEICFGDDVAAFGYTISTESPDQYSIVFDTTAEGKGFVNVSNVSLSGGVINISVPVTATPASYNAKLTVRNSMTGCVSADYDITIVVHALPATGEIVPD